MLPVAAGAAIGGVFRHLATRGAAPLTATLGRVCAVNVTGSIAIGAISALGRESKLSPRIALALSTGFCGGLTTFSTFAAGAMTALRDERPALAALYVIGSCVLGLAGVAAGEAVVRRHVKW